MNESARSVDLVGATTEVVAAYVSNNAVPTDELRSLIRSVHAALNRVVESRATVKQQPAVAIADSVTPDYLVCLEDGKRFKSLKRHLRSRYDMSPEEYRAKWKLPAGYPMVAPNYAKARSDLAKAIGLGRPDAYQVAA